MHKPLLNERGASSWDLVLKILSITLVSLFAFSSGVWFGKKLSDSDHQRMALEGEFDKEVRKTASADENSEALDDKEALSDEEVAAAADKALESSKAKTEVAEKAEAVDAHGGHDAHAAPAHGEKVATKTEAKAETKTAATAEKSAPAAKDAHVAAPATKVAAAAKEDAHAPAAKVAAKEDAHAAPAAKATHAEKPAARAVASTGEKANSKPDLSAVHQAATRVANNAAPVDKEKPAPESRVPSSLPKTVGATNDVEFTVQVASYPTAEAAKEHVESMVKKGFPAFPVEAKINGKVWYRVSVGSFKSFNDASKFRAQLLKQADLPSAIVQKVSR